MVNSLVGGTRASIARERGPRVRVVVLCLGSAVLGLLVPDTLAFMMVLVLGAMVYQEVGLLVRGPDFSELAGLWQNLV